MCWDENDRLHGSGAWHVIPGCVSLPSCLNPFLAQTARFIQDIPLLHGAHLRHPGEQGEQD